MSNISVGGKYEAIGSDVVTLTINFTLSNNTIKGLGEYIWINITNDKHFAISH